MYSYLYMWHTYILYQIGLMSKECEQQLLKTHDVFAPISSFMKRWSYNFNTDLNFYNDLSFLYLLITLWMIFKITFIQKFTWEFIMVRKNLLVLWTLSVLYKCKQSLYIVYYKPTTYTSWKHLCINFERNITERLL